MIPPFDFTRFLPAIRLQAAALFPQECCGFIIQDQHTAFLYPVRNVHEKPNEAFLMPDDALMQAERKGEIIAIYHSHPNSPSAQLTDTDIRCYEELGEIPWIVVNHPFTEYVIHKSDSWRWPLIGRPYEHEITDCYELGRDYYKRKLGILLPHFPRAPLWWEAADAEEMYLNNYTAQGFVDVGGKPQKHDAILMQLRSSKVNHGAIYLGDGLILHHVYGRASCIAPYDGFWMHCTRKILRHKSLC